MSTANFLRNRSPTSALALDGITPFQAWYGKKPNLGFMRVFGCKAMVHTPQDIRSKTSWDSHTTECILIGFSDTENLFELWDIAKGAAIKRRDVIFFEDKLGSEVFRETALKRGIQIFPSPSIPASYAEMHIRDNPRPVPPIDKPVLPLPRRPPQQTVNRLPPNLPDPTSERSDRARQVVFKEPVVQHVSNTGQYPEVSFTTPLGVDTPELILTSIQQPDNAEPGEENSMLTMMMAAVDSLTPITVDRYTHLDYYLPRTYHQAIFAPEGDKWLTAMHTQLKKLQDAHTWELVFLPPGRHAIGNKWVFSKKDGAKAKSTDNTDIPSSLHTARLVARGDLQTKGIDYDETFAPVVKLVSLRMLLAYAAFHDLDLVHWDIVAAFLNGELKEEVYMRQPQGFEDGTGRVCKLTKSIYGLCQSARCGSAHDGVWLEVYCFIVLLFYCLAVIVLLFYCLRVYCGLSTYCLAAYSVGTHRGSTRDYCSTLWGGVSIGRCLDRQDCVYKHVVARS